VTFILSYNACSFGRRFVAVAGFNTTHGVLRPLDGFCDGHSLRLIDPRVCLLHFVAAPDLNSVYNSDRNSEHQESGFTRNLWYIDGNLREILSARPKECTRHPTPRFDARPLFSYLFRSGSNPFGAMY